MGNKIKGSTGKFLMWTLGVVLLALAIGMWTDKIPPASAPYLAWIGVVVAGLEVGVFSRGRFINITKMGGAEQFTFWVMLAGMVLGTMLFFPALAVPFVLGLSNIVIASLGVVTIMQTFL